eukprot:TRINITY_DN32180_c0_g1_i1.p1 TRINITY_DN32180_c0_g1~~TRINITY_DN32180_c0_g1_i1.p1  ORF type:complete len:680 (+),score=127.98 TRINITY_DN32180_c0_g1_i1:237-2042(+)
MIARKREIGETEKFDLITHEDGFVSLKSLYGYVAADKGGLRASRAKVGAWERFQLKPRGTKPAEGNGVSNCSGGVRVLADDGRQASTQIAAAERGPPMFDACCELEAVLLAEEHYARRHSDRTAITYDRRCQARRAAGVEFSFRHFREERAYPNSFSGCVSAWDATQILGPGEMEADVTERRQLRPRLDSDNSEFGIAKPRRAWETIISEGLADSVRDETANINSSGDISAGHPAIYAAFGIPASSAAEADDVALTRLDRLCRLPCCVAVGPVSLDCSTSQAADVLANPILLKKRHESLSAAAFEAEFGVRPAAKYESRRDPQCVAWLASGPGLAAETWMVKYGDKRLAEFDAASRDYERRRQDAQSAVAQAQVRLARELDLALIVQLPSQDEAERQMSGILVAELDGDRGVNQRILLSAFRGRPICAASLLRRFPRLFIGFSGLLTHSKLKHSLGEVAFDTSMERLVLESLGPRYPPAVAGVGDARGSYSHPAHISIIAEELANVKQVTSQEILRASSSNATALFNLPGGHRDGVAVDAKATEHVIASEATAESVAMAEEADGVSSADADAPPSVDADANPAAEVAPCNAASSLDGNDAA